MANTLRIKRRPSSGSAGAPSSLYNGELAFNENDNILYYGYGSGIGGVATSFPSIGGSGAYTLLGGTNATGTWPIGITGNAGTVTSGVYTSRTLTAGSGLVGGGDLSANRTFDIGQGDGISVSADSIAVDSTVIRTTGTQTITGNKTFSGTSSFTAANTTGNSVGYFAVFDSDPNSTSQALKSVSKDQILDDIGAATSGLTLTAGSGLTGGGTLSTDRTFHVGQGDGITVSADSIAVNSSVVRTTTGGIANHIAYWNSSSGIVADSGQLYWDASNNRLGIGTSSPSGSLDVNGAVTFRSDSNTITNVFTELSDASLPHGAINWYNDYDNGGVIGNIASIHVSTDTSPTEGILSFSTRNNSSPSERMRIRADGNVGIATTSPTEKLHVDGKGLFSSGVNISNQTANTIASFDGSKNVVSLSTSTYPSLTELSYVKGVTSAIQTQIDGKTTTSRTLTAGSGLVGGGTLAADRTFDIGQGDGISVSADSIAVDSTVVRTTGTQSVNGSKTFGNLTVFGSGITSSGTNSLQVAATASTATQFTVFTSSPSSSAQTIYTRTPSEVKTDIGLGNVENTSLSSVTFTAGSGLVGGGTLGSSRTFDIGQGDGISVSADSIAVDSTVVRTTGTQTINGVKTLGNTTYFNSGILSSGTNSIQAASTGSTATQFAVFTSSPNSSAQTVFTRTPSEVKTDIGLSNVTNDAQVKKIASTTIGYIPTWAVTSGDQLATGYSVETTLTGGSTAIARADAVKTYIDNLLGANDAMIFKGTIGTGGTVTALPTTYSAGWTYRVITAGTYAGVVCEIGDLIIAVIDRSGSGNLNSDWTVAQTNIDGAVINTRTLTAGSGLTGGGDLSADRTFNIGAGDGITVNADDVAVDSTVVRTTGTQNITGNKNFSGTVVSSGTLSLKMATTASTATQFPVFTSDPSSTAQTVSTRTPSQVKTDIGLSNVENTALSTWAGSTNITTLGTIGTGTWSATTIAANKGGTGQSSYTIGDLLYADTSSTLAKLADVATGNVLLAGGVATAPSWGKVNLTSGTHVSGTLPVTNGGTGQSSYTDGQLLIGNSTGNTLTKATLTEGTGIDITNGGGSITIIHEDTSTLSGAQGTNGIASITVDGLGHVTAVTTATYLTAATVCAAITDCTLDGGTF